MKSFLVMQGYTYEEEKELGFIWAAKKDRGGLPSHSWQRMQEVEEEDIIFHCVKGEILAVSVATSDCQIAHRPTSMSQDGQQGEEGYLVTLNYYELDVPIHIRSKIEEIAPLLPIKYSPFQTNGHGNQGYLYPCNEQFAVKLLELIADSNITEVEDEQLTFAISSVMPSEKNVLIPFLTAAESEAKMKIRYGEEKFRKRLMPIWAHQCAICHIDLSPLLIASRAKPWKDCTEAERVDPYNGLLLCSNHHLLYQQGFIAFDGQGKIHISPQLAEVNYEKYDLHKKIKIERQEGHKPYVKWHKKYLFKA